MRLCDVYLWPRNLQRCFAMCMCRLTRVPCICCGTAAGAITGQIFEVWIGSSWGDPQHVGLAGIEVARSVWLQLQRNNQHSHTHAPPPPHFPFSF